MKKPLNFNLKDYINVFVLSSVIIIPTLFTAIAYLNAYNSIANESANPYDLMTENGSWMELSDKRILEYFLTGNSKSKKIVLVIPDFGQTGKSVSKLFDKEETKPIRIMCVTPPGFGKSTPNPKGDLLTFARDIDEVTRRMNYNSFNVIGIGHGTSYAVSLTFYLNDKVENIALINPISEIGYQHDRIYFHDYYNEIYLFNNPVTKSIFNGAIKLPVFNEIFGYYFFKPIFSSSDEVEQYLSTLYPKNWKELNQEGSQKNLLIEDYQRAPKDYIEGLNDGLKFGDGSIAWPFNVSQIQYKSQTQKRNIDIHIALDDEVIPSKVQLYLTEILTESRVYHQQHGHFYLFANPQYLLNITFSFFPEN